MPIVRIDWYEGRTLDQKKQIAREFTDTLMEVTGCPADSVSVVFNDLPRSDMAKAGVITTD